jgi:hypothetical protein
MGERQVDCCICFYLVSALVKDFGGVSASKICPITAFLPTEKQSYREPITVLGRLLLQW